MENTNKRKRQVNSPYNKWNHEGKLNLIDLRIKYDRMFTGKNANQRDGWRKIREELGKSSVLCRQQWQALIRKYKSLTQKPSGSGMGDEALEGDVGAPISWPYFDAIHKYASTKDNFHPPHLSCNIDGMINSPHNILDEEIAYDRDTPGPSTSTDNSRSTPLSANSSWPRFRSSRSTTSKAEEQLTRETKKISNKLNAALTIFGQMVQIEYPQIDVSTLLISESEDSN